MSTTSSFAIVMVHLLAVSNLVPPEFDSDEWPGRLSAAEARALQPLVDRIVRGMATEDIGAIKDGVHDLREGLGRYAGIPETKPEYGAPIDRTTPDLQRVIQHWENSFQRLQGRQGWELAAPANAELQTGPRLRVSLRHARAYLHSYESGLLNRDAYLQQALAGFDYIVSSQSRTYGVFGYPYHPAGSGLKRAAAQTIENVLNAGHAKSDVIENGWIVNAFGLGDGGLQFDNGMCGVGLVYAYAVSGNDSYLESAKRAGAWAAEQPLVANWNYNCFSGHLLARLYRATGEREYLDQAAKKFEFGVLPGMMDNGRWIDQHNAKVQYHAVMLRALIEYYLALVQAGDSDADRVGKQIKLGLDNLAEQIITYGSSNFHEMLSLDALCLGVMVWGPNDRWIEAANINVNYLIDHADEKLRAAGLPLTETIANYILYRRNAAGETDVRPREVAPRLGITNEANSVD